MLIWKLTSYLESGEGDLRICFISFSAVAEMLSHDLDSGTVVRRFLTVTPALYDRSLPYEVASWGRYITWPPDAKYENAWSGEDGLLGSLADSRCRELGTLRLNIQFSSRGSPLVGTSSMRTLPSAAPRTPDTERRSFFKLLKVGDSSLCSLSCKYHIKHHIYIYY